MPKLHKFHKLYRWIPAIALMLVIFILSSQSYEQQDLRPDIQSSISEQSVADRFGGISFQYAGHEISIESLGVAGFIEFFIRKGAHFFSYGLLAILVMFALYPQRRLRRFLLAVMISFLYACSDELHQMFTPNRTAKFQDVMLDTAGAIFGAIIMVLLITWRQKRIGQRQ
ncbi:VanZ family protein [Paenibacillus puldeungensis]|uniref:VanZ family protein n=1 Tax=Paenibacillus puldeungensis TaxID=696536 RepID=UPI0036D3E47F